MIKKFLWTNSNAPFFYWYNFCGEWNLLTAHKDSHITCNDVAKSGTDNTGSHEPIINSLIISFFANFQGTSH